MSPAQIDAGERGSGAEIKGLRRRIGGCGRIGNSLHGDNFLRGGRPPKPLIMGLIHTLRAEGHVVESVCYVQREQGCHIAEQTY